MPTGSIKMTTTQKVLKTWSVKGLKHHYLGSNQRGSGSSRNPQRSSRGGSNVTPSTRARGRGRGSSRYHRRSIASETVNHPITTVPTRAYGVRARKYQDAPRVIAGNFTLYDTEMHALVDPGSTHCYICIE